MIPLYILYQLVTIIASAVTTFVSLPLLFAFLVAFCGITAFGYLFTHYFRKYYRHRLERIAKRDTILGHLVSLVLNIEGMSEKAKEAFDNPVLYYVDEGISKLGFITDQDLDVLTLERSQDSELVVTSDSVWVYAPNPINFFGELLLVERRRIKILDSEENESLPLFVLSGGLIEKENKQKA